MFDSICPLEYRYLDFPEAKDVRRYLSEEAFIKYIVFVEAQLVRAYALEELCPSDVADIVEKAAENIDIEEVYKEEKRIKHQLRAIVNCLAKKSGPQASPWIHLGATSHDIICTSDSLRHKDFTLKLLIPCFGELLKNLIDVATREKATPQMGRTHGQHAVTTTFGFAISEYISRIGSRICKIHEAANNLRGQFSGAVGSYNAQSLILDNPITFETKYLNILGLKPGDHSTQIIEPEYILDLLHHVISAFGVLANFSDDMRHLQRSEIDEIAEAFEEAQVGSSTMPHKKNPINFENAKSLYKTFMPRILTYYMDQISEHQRDLSNSASSRFIGEILCSLYIVARRLGKTVSKLIVNHNALKQNIEKNGKKIMAEAYYLILSKHGITDAHEFVRKHIHSGGDLSNIEKAFPDLRLTEEEIKILSSPQNYIGKAVEKTEEICEKWKRKLAALKL